MELNPNMAKVTQQSTILFDTHAYVRHMKQGGFSEQQAEASAEALADAFRGGLVTIDVLKNELLICRDEFNEKIQEIRTEIQEIRTEIQEVRTEIQGVRTEIQEVRTEIQGVRTEFGKEINRMLYILGGAIGASFIALTTLMITLKFLI